MFASSAEALSVKHDFTAFVGPFNASTAEFEYTLTKKSYAVRSVVRTNGTFGFLYPFEANYYTGGSIEGDRLETSAYRYTSQSRFNKRSKVMIYNEDGQPVFAVSSKNGREKCKKVFGKRTNACKKGKLKFKNSRKKNFSAGKKRRFNKKYERSANK